MKTILLSHMGPSKKIAGLKKENNRPLRMKVRTYVNKHLVTDKKKNILLAHAMKEIPTQLRLIRRLLITKSIVLSHTFPAKQKKKQQKILGFGRFGKEINRQLRMKLQTHVNKRSVTDKGTFYCACVIKEIPNFGNL